MRWIRRNSEWRKCRSLGTRTRKRNGGRGAEGREFLKRQSAAGTAKRRKGSPIVSGLYRASSVQIALRLPAPDLAKARKVAGHKGIGYQTLLKMLVHEWLQREARRQ